jgi:hypothetical protein
MLDVKDVQYGAEIQELVNRLAIVRDAKPLLVLVEKTNATHLVAGNPL